LASRAQGRPGRQDEVFPQFSKFGTGFSGVLKVNRGSIFFPLNPNKLRFGEVVNFNIYVKSDNPGADKPEYSLFCRRGEIFNPGHLAKIKFIHIHCVYYHRRDKDNVAYYLNPDLTLVGDIQFFKQKKRLGATLISKKEVYIPMPVKNLQLGIKVNFDVFKKTKCIKKMDYNYDTFIRKGDICQPTLIDDLNQKGINYVYFREQDETEVLQYLYHNLSLILKDNRLPPGKKTEMIYNVALIWTRRFYYEKHLRTPEEMRAGFKLIDYLLNMFHQDKYYLQWVPGLRRHGDKLHAHCLNTCILGLAFTKYLGWPDEEIIEFARGALLHDLGMVEVPQTLLDKPGRLSKVEMELIKKHPQDSCLIIKDIGFTSLNSLVMIFQHHEYGDGSGYTQGLKLPSINHWARILRIIDSYEAMTANRSWREKFDPVGALSEMRQECSERGTFDTNYLIDFIKLLSGNCG
jgi:HD-GYP domain-containing protein (c-di-GMP phosphodiesterase class II)